MATLLSLHSESPQVRLITQAAQALKQDALIAYPTDSGYALGWHIDNRVAQERVIRLRGLDTKHNFTVVCRTLGEISTYARMDDVAFQLIRKLTPGPYTFILPATAQLPKRLHQAKKRSVGVRIPDHAVALALLGAVGEPLLSSSLILPNEEMGDWEVEDVYEHVKYDVDFFIDSGHCDNEPTTVIDLLSGTPQLVRQGKGSTDLI